MRRSRRNTARSAVSIATWRRSLTPASTSIRTSGLATPPPSLPHWRGERKRRQRPAILFGLVTPVILLLVMATLAAGVFVTAKQKAYDTQKTMEERVNERNRFIAEMVAEDIDDRLEGYIRGLEDTAGEPETSAVLKRAKPEEFTKFIKQWRQQSPEREAARFDVDHRSERHHPGHRSADDVRSRLSMARLVQRQRRQGQGHAAGADRKDASVAAVPVHGRRAAHADRDHHADPRCGGGESGRGGAGHCD